MAIFEIMTDLLLHNARVILPDRIQRGGVLIREGLIAGVFLHEQTPAGISSRESIDLQEAYLAPGLIDIHIHGSAGVDVQDTDSAGLSKLSEFLLSEGVTGYFATFVPTDEPGYRAAASTVESYIAGQARTAAGARILGIHFEGPFVSHNKCGALQPEHFRTYDLDLRSIETFIKPDPKKASYSRLMTLAPEVSGGIELTRALGSRGVRVFIGHTRPDAPTAVHARDPRARAGDGRCVRGRGRASAGQPRAGPHDTDASRGVSVG